MTILEQDVKIVRDMGKAQGLLKPHEGKCIAEFGELAGIKHLSESSIIRRFNKAIDLLWHKNICDRRYNGKKITYVFR